jgi:hypothetical protein
MHRLRCRGTLISSSDGLRLDLRFFAMFPMTDSLRRTFTVSFLSLAAMAGPASAQYVTLDGVRRTGPVQVQPGERLIRLEDGATEGSTVLAGRTVELGGANALIGASSDAVFVAVASGAARVGDVGAGPGEALLLTPYGGAPSVVEFDAERMVAMFGPQPPQSLSGFVADLASVADDQSWGIFFGLYQRSLFDLQTPGGARTEAGRVSVMGAPEVVRIRFSGQSNPDAIEDMVVARAAQALAAGDAAALAQLLDPAPYGGDNLNGGGQEARLAVAKQLIAEHGRAAAGEVRRGAGEGVWRAGSVTLRTRPFSDFVFVSSVE